jgi:hypothetical protein
MRMDQYNELADLIYRHSPMSLGISGQLAELLLEEGYYRAVEGCWDVKKSPIVGDYRFTCSRCGYAEWRGPAWQAHCPIYRVCPSCGAKIKEVRMKGADNERRAD